MAAKKKLTELDYAIFDDMVLYVSYYNTLSPNKPPRQSFNKKDIVIDKMTEYFVQDDVYAMYLFYYAMAQKNNNGSLD